MYACIKLRACYQESKTKSVFDSLPLIIEQIELKENTKTISYENVLSLREGGEITQNKNIFPHNVKLHCYNNYGTYIASTSAVVQHGMATTQGLKT